MSRHGVGSANLADIGPAWSETCFKRGLSFGMVRVLESSRHRDQECTLKNGQPVRLADIDRRNDPRA